MRGIDFNFYTSLKTKQNYAWTWFHFFLKLEPEETMLEVSGFIFTQAWTIENYACDFPTHNTWKVGT